MQTQTRHYSVEEYLALEETSESKHEYWDGEIVVMAGGTTNHNEIAGNFYSHFKMAMRGQGYKIYIGDVKLSIPRHRLYTYPDIMVISGVPVYEETGITIVTNPTLIIEVLSNSTHNYDRTNKFKMYRSITTLQEYILIDQYSANIEQFAKNSQSQWVLTECESIQDTLVLNSMAFEMSLESLYEGVDFATVEP